MKSFILITFFILAICAIGSEAAKTWLPAVTGYNKNDSNNGYAGIFNKPITGLRVSGNNYYRVHIKGKSWLPAVYGNNQNDHNNGYAGTSNGDVIDGVAIAGGVQYAVHIQGGQWLPAVTGYNINDGNNGYAGILGKPIDAIMIKGRTYATSYNTSYVPPPVPDDIYQRVRTIYTYLKNNVSGVTKSGVAAVLGCWAIESNIEPKRAEGDYLSPPVGASSKSDSCWDNDSWLNMSGPQIYNGNYPNIIHRGLGLGQWTDTYDASRSTLLRNYAKQKGMKWYDLTLQLDFMLNGDYQYARNVARGILSHTISYPFVWHNYVIKCYEKHHKYRSIDLNLNLCE